MHSMYGWVFSRPPPPPPPKKKKIESVKLLEWSRWKSRLWQATLIIPEYNGSVKVVDTKPVFNGNSFDVQAQSFTNNIELMFTANV